MSCDCTRVHYCVIAVNMAGDIYIVDLPTVLSVVVTAVLSDWQCWRRSNVVLLAVLVTHLIHWLTVWRTSLISTNSRARAWWPPAAHRLKLQVHTVPIPLPPLYLHYWIFHTLCWSFLVFSCCPGVCRVYYYGTYSILYPCNNAMLTFCLCTKICT